VNSGSAPAWIFLCHPLDESSTLGINFGSAKPFRARSEAPEQTEPSPMPGDNCFRPDDDKDAAP
jgi:hypothetical protein